MYIYAYISLNRQRTTNREQQYLEISVQPKYTLGKEPPSCSFREQHFWLENTIWKNLLRTVYNINVLLPRRPPAAASENSILSGEQLIREEYLRIVNAINLFMPRCPPAAALREQHFCLENSIFEKNIQWTMYNVHARIVLSLSLSPTHTHTYSLALSLSHTHAPTHTHTPDTPQL